MREKELAIFCTQIEMILKAGITLSEGVGMIAEDIEEHTLANHFKRIEKYLEEGRTLHDALEEEGSFPSYMVHMVKIGSLSGRMEEVMGALGHYYDREDQLRQSVRGAVFYPLLLCFMMFVVMLFLSIKVLPVFEKVFNTLGGSLVGLAHYFMRFGELLSRYIYGVVGIMGVVLISVILLLKTQKGTTFIKNLINHLKITEKIAISRFASALSLMLASGMDTEEALKTALMAIENKKVQARGEESILLMESGKGFIEALREGNFFSSLTLRKLSIGLRTGNLDEVMVQVANQYDEEVQEALAKVVSLIEPILVGILAVVIGSVLLSVMLPLMGIMASIG
ncbi:type II secretion system F family protein [Sporanaerobium hydrogeniformans]|uniref:type II secretion system F family protein n=1 Tax=Sporanaerobium hydrogeniformans TaxID=3072179 RepID=UPI0015D4E401|nr:type II secretion system F family protein [Sporanaerobium hydrogeniformans]